MGISYAGQEIMGGAFEGNMIFEGVEWVPITVQSYITNSQNVQVASPITAYYLKFDNYIIFKPDMIYLSSYSVLKVNTTLPNTPTKICTFPTNLQGLNVTVLGYGGDGNYTEQIVANIDADNNLFCDFRLISGNSQAGGSVIRPINLNNLKITYTKEE